MASGKEARMTKGGVPLPSERVAGVTIGALGGARWLFGVSSGSESAVAGSGILLQRARTRGCDCASLLKVATEAPHLSPGELP